MSGRPRPNWPRPSGGSSNCTIRAPISGTILKKNAEEGNIVNPIAFNGSFSLCDMADLSDLEVDLSIQERDIARIFPGQKCKDPDRGVSRSACTTARCRA